jgi:hypothetical protein
MEKTITIPNEAGGLIINVDKPIEAFLLDAEFKNCSRENFDMCLFTYFEGMPNHDRHPIRSVSNGIENSLSIQNKSGTISKLIIACCPKSLKAHPQDWSVKVKFTILY